MSKTLQEFISNVKRGLAKTSHFSVMFNRPLCIPASLFDDITIQKIHLFCEQATLPAMNIVTSPIRTWGEVREMPYDRMFDPVTLTFYVDTDMKVKLFFDKWISSIQGYSSRQFNFYENYIVDLEVEVFDSGENSKYKVTLVEAYPKTLNAVEMNYNGKDIMRVQVTMAYRYWYTQQMTSNYMGGEDKSLFGIDIGDTFASALTDTSRQYASTFDWQNVLKSADLPPLF